MESQKLYHRQWYLGNKKQVKEKAKEYRQNHPEQIKLYQKEYRKNNPEKLRKSKKEWNDAHKEEMKEYQKIYNLKSNYGISVEEYENLLAKQNGKCAICGNLFVKTPYVDHDHITGKVRGLLCHQCNSGLGYFKDNLELLNKAVNYLRIWKKQQHHQ
jgi:5-methylcytosine-specific restriction endonuclease McrA